MTLLVGESIDSSQNKKPKNEGDYKMKSRDPNYAPKRRAAKHCLWQYWKYNLNMTSIKQ